MATMRAWQVYRHGEPRDALRLVDLEVPEPGPGEVRIGVTAACLGLARRVHVPGRLPAHPAAALRRRPGSGRCDHRRRPWRGSGRWDPGHEHDGLHQWPGRLRRADHRQRPGRLRPVAVDERRRRRRLLHRLPHRVDRPGAAGTGLPRRAPGRARRIRRQRGGRHPARERSSAPTSSPPPEDPSGAPSAGSRAPTW